MRWPKDGFTVCPKHGADAPQVIAARDRRVAEREAIAALEVFGVPIVVDPHTALLQELHRTAGAVAWAGAVVQSLEKDDLVWGVTKEKTGGDDHGTTRESKPNAWYVIWVQERKHLVEVSKACVSAGIEERRVRLEERDARMVVAKFESAVTKVGLTDVQAHALKVAFAEEFLAVEVGAS